ncbi:MAG: MBL fold metallo-hydrolase [Actinomycetaceae bacterium]|nr:MBL fold metallo-hydrolase [Actinomycetaceae bacterium]
MNTNAKPVVTCKFLGAVGTVTGSKYLLSIGDRDILIDAGIYQGEKHWRLKNWEQFIPAPSTISDILITHAHADHVGFLPVLVQQGFKGTIWATAATVELAKIVLRDAGNLQLQDARNAQKGGYSKHEEPLALFTPDDVEKTLKHFKAVPFDRDIDFGGFSARWVHAAHILGSASILLTVAGERILFSGDLGREDPTLLRPRGKTPQADWVIMESTYGDRTHLTPELPHEDMARAIRDTAARGGKVLIPAFAIDRTEAVLAQLVEMMRDERIPSLPVFVDSPMGLRALDVYQEFADEEMRREIDVSDFMGMPRLSQMLSTEQSKKINTFKGPCIIVTSSGMLEGGRVLHHLQRLLPDAKNCLIITGFQASGTRGRKIVDGASSVKMHGWYVPVRAQIVQDREFSAHADKNELLRWLAQVGEPDDVSTEEVPSDEVPGEEVPADELPREEVPGGEVSAERREPRGIFLTHGEHRAAYALAQSIKEELGWNVVLPEFGEIVRFQPHFEG